MNKELYNISTKSARTASSSF